MTATEAQATQRGDRIPERRVAAVLATLAGVAVVAAVALNAAFADLSGPGARPGDPQAGGSVDVSGTVSAAVDKPPLEMLPEALVGYEAISRQGVPGRQDTSAEAMYVTLNMETEIQVPIGSYAHAEAYASPAEAQAAVDGLMAREFPLKPAGLVLGGVTPAVSGYAPNEGAWAVAWTRGSYAIYVKTLFRDKVPAQRRDFLHRLGLPVAEGIDKYQRTGQQGLKF